MYYKAISYILGAGTMLCILQIYLKTVVATMYVIVSVKRAVLTCSSSDFEVGSY